MLDICHQQLKVSRIRTHYCQLMIFSRRKWRNCKAAVALLLHVITTGNGVSYKLIVYADGSRNRTLPTFPPAPLDWLVGDDKQKRKVQEERWKNAPKWPPWYKNVYQRETLPHHLHVIAILKAMR